MSLLLILSAKQAFCVCRPFPTTLLKSVWSCGRLRASYSSLINVYNTYSAKTTCIIKALRESAAIWGHLKSLIHVLYWETTTCRRSSGGTDMQTARIPRILHYCSCHARSDRCNALWNFIIRRIRLTVGRIF